MKRLAASLAGLLLFFACVVAKADLKIQTGSVALPTTATTVDLTISGFGTAKAALIFVTSASADGSVTDSAGWSAGAVVDGAECTAGIADDHGVGTSDVARVAEEDEVIALLSTSTDTVTVEIEGSGDTDAGSGPITDGWRVNIGAENTSTAYLAKFILFGGSSLSANVGTADLNATQDTATTESLNASAGDGQFEADLLFVMDAGGGIPQTNAGAGHHAFGVAHNGGSQKAVFFTGEDDQALSDNIGRLDSDSVTGQHSASGAVLLYTAEAGNFTSTGFDLTTRDDNLPSAREVCYLALKIDGASIAVWSQDSFTDAGADWAVTTPGFQPVFGMIGATPFTAEDTDEVAGNAYAFSVCMFDGTNENCAGVATENNQGTTDTASLVETKAIGAMGGGNAQIHEADTVVFDSLGWDIAAANIDTANATLRKWFGLAIGGTPGELMRRRGR